MSQLAHLLLVALAVSFLTANTRAEFTPRDYQARRIDSPPVLDGVLDDVAWQTAEHITDFYAYQSGGAPPAASTSARILWDDDNVYLGFEMQDSDIRPSSLTAGETGRDASLFRGDVIEFFVRQDRQSPQYHEFEWSPNGIDVFDARFDNVRFGAPGKVWNTDIEWSVSVAGTTDDTSDVDERWFVEAAIALSSFEPIDFDSEWTFAVARYDFFNPTDASPQLMMSTPGDPELRQAGLTSGFHTYELYDNLRFVHALGDFNRDQSIDIEDMNALTLALQSNDSEPSFDLDSSGTLDDADLSFMVHVAVGTWFGDANLDGLFDSKDLVVVFQSAEYEDAIPGNSTWGTGDWNADGEFTSLDLIVAFQDAGYEKGARSVAVPESIPSTSLLHLFVGSIGIMGRRRGRWS